MSCLSCPYSGSVVTPARPDELGYSGPGDRKASSAILGKESLQEELGPVVAPPWSCYPGGLQMGRHPGVEAQDSSLGVLQLSTICYLSTALAHSGRQLTFWK